MTLGQQLHNSPLHKPGHDPACPVCNPGLLKRPAYRVPLGTFLGRGPSTERLYQLEERRDAAIKLAAEELQRVWNFQHFWREALPEALLSILEGHDKQASRLAAQAFLAKYPPEAGK